MGLHRHLDVLLPSVLGLMLLASPASSHEALLKPSPPVLNVSSQIPWRKADVLALAEKAGDYQLATMAAGLAPAPDHPYPDTKGWEQGALFVGLMALADRSLRPEFEATLFARGKANAWKLGDSLYDADSHVIGSSYLWAYRHGAGPVALEPMRASLDEILRKPPENDLTFVDNGATCRNRWCWCDALFMAPAVWLEMSRITGDQRYSDYAKKEFRATTDKLLDPESHLYFRDSRFFDRRDIDGKKLFWSRGDGWVFAGLARMIPLLPEGDPERAHMENIFKDMAATLASLQKPDGFWSPSLLGDPDVSLPESSGTGFYTFGLAWGIKTGLLDRKIYEPHVRAGWAALVRSIQPNGKVGYVQPVGDQPDAVGYDDTQLYGVGAFLMAAGELADLDLSPPKAVTALRVSNPSAFDQDSAIGRISIALPKRSAGGWSIAFSGRNYPADYQDGVLSFVMPIKARTTQRVLVYPEPAPLPVTVHAVLNIQDGGTPHGSLISGGTFHLRKSYKIPASHVIHDGLIAFEGVGWESDKIAYRLYLDERNVTDIYGKKLGGPILQRIGQNSGDYHAMSDWGQDIFQVDQSLGIGGLGKVRGGKALQIGPSTITAEVKNTAISGEAIIINQGFEEGKSSVKTRYKIYHGQALTFVDAQQSGAPETMATGFRHHKDVELITGKSDGEWTYFATWGQQDLTADDLGLVIFFRPKDILHKIEDDGQSFFVSFKNPGFMQYAFAATWVQDASAVRDTKGFKTWLDTTLDGLNHPLLITTSQMLSRTLGAKK